MCILGQAFEVPCVVRQELLICCDKGSIAAPNKKWRQWDVRQVLPIVAIFAECSTRRPSDNKFSGANRGGIYRGNRENRDNRDNMDNRGNR